MPLGRAYDSPVEVEGEVEYHKILKILITLLCVKKILG
jgi:hypothetical protein